MELFDYIEVFYNQRRRHSTLGQISPAEFERRGAAVDAAVLWTRTARPPGTWKTDLRPVSDSDHSHHPRCGTMEDNTLIDVVNLSTETDQVQATLRVEDDGEHRLACRHSRRWGVISHSRGSASAQAVL